MVETQKNSAQRQRSYLPGLRTARHDQAMTIAQLATASGLTSGSISALENLQRGANPGTVRKLSDALGTSPAALRKEPPKGQPSQEEQSAHEEQLDHEE